MVDSVGGVNPSSSWRPDEEDSDTKKDNRSQGGNTGTPQASDNSNGAAPPPASESHDDVTPENSGDGTPQSTAPAQPEDPVKPNEPTEPSQPSQPSPSSPSSPSSQQVSHDPASQRGDPNAVPPPPNADPAIYPSLREAPNLVPPANADLKSPVLQTRQPRQAPPLPANNSHDVVLKPPVQQDPAGMITNPDGLSMYNALYQPSASNHDSRLNIQLAEFDQSTGCVGMTNLVMRTAAEYASDSDIDLYAASDAVVGLSHSSDTGRNYVVGQVASAQRAWIAGNMDIDLPNHERWPLVHLEDWLPDGRPGDATDQMIDSLRSHFAVNTFTDPATGRPVAPAIDMAIVAFRSRVTEPTGESIPFGHIVGIQRKRASGDYLQDDYVLYDNDLGAFRYHGFNQMEYALRNYWRGTFPSNDQHTVYEGDLLFDMTPGVNRVRF